MPDPQHIEVGDDPRLAALMAWRQQLIESGAVSRNSFKEAHLRLVLRSGRTDVAQIRAMLPGSVAEHAEDMARLLVELETQSGRSGGESGSAAGRHRTGVAEPRVDGGADSEKLFRPALPNAPPPRHTEELQYRASDFAAFSFGEQLGEVHAIGLRRRQRGEDSSGLLELTWPPYLPAAGGAETVVIYRVVSEEDDPPYSPDRAHLVAGSTATSATDERPPGAAVRHYQVWVNTGPTHGQALAAQPVKYAEAVLVSPVRDFLIREDNGQVIGQWNVPSAVSDVFIYRIPAEEAGREGLQHRILTGSDNRGGFVDTEAQRGQRYIYRVRCAVTVDGVMRLSEATEATVAVSAVLIAGARSVDGCAQHRWIGVRADLDAAAGRARRHLPQPDRSQCRRGDRRVARGRARANRARSGTAVDPTGVAAPRRAGPTAWGDVRGVVAGQLEPGLFHPGDPAGRARPLGQNPVGGAHRRSSVTSI